jgi:hypothetical protein
MVGSGLQALVGAFARGHFCNLTRKCGGFKPEKSFFRIFLRFSPIMPEKPEGKGAKEQVGKETPAGKKELRRKDCCDRHF